MRPILSIQFSVILLCLQDFVLSSPFGDYFAEDSGRIDPNNVVLRKPFTETLLNDIFLAISVVRDFFKFLGMRFSAYLYGFYMSV